MKLTEELLRESKIKKGGLVLDLASGNGVTSMFLAKEYGYKVVAGDLWSDPSDNKKFFDAVGVGERVTAIKADAENLPFARETFDAIVCVDAYNFFGRDKSFFGNKILPYVKKGGYVYIAVPGMKEDYHSRLPKALLVTWTPEAMEYMQDMTYWKNTIAETAGIEIISFKEMETNENAWADWIEQDNEYAKGDKKAVAAGALDYLNFIEIIIRKK